ncbi:E3 SUMO-protein ligase PIAS4-like isoform X2 [Planococcus citri]|uniref:E3 SUMO-protein ligase PIAS4-like isoform X2 n=1 Tax=Planococcus citri TaxID=170843 RepID=UPI0031F84BA1
MNYGFRCSDLVSLLGYVGRNRSGRKNELQLRALEILKNPPADINIEAFKHKIKFLYKAAQDEAKQTHNLELQQQQQNMMPYNMPGGRVQQIMPPQQAMQPQPRPSANINHYGVPSAQYANQPQRYPGGMPVGGNPYQSSGFTQSIQPANSTPLCNFGLTVLVPNANFYTPFNELKFRKLPFYNIKHELLKPTVLVSNHVPTLPNNLRTSATQEFHYCFVLTCDMASDMASNRDIGNGKNDYNVQAQLRITATDNTTGNVTEYNDFLPLGLVVRLNHRQCTLPICSPNSRSGTESRRIPRPINITPHMKMSPICQNLLVINWACEQGKTFVANVNLVEKLSSDYLLNKLKERPTISVDLTKATIRQQYKRIDDDDDEDNDNTNADDDDIATTIVRVSLVCPLAKFRMMYPAKGKNCTHLQCFDGGAYISLNEKKPMWMCPVCNRELYFDDLLIDQYFSDVLQNKDLSPDCQEVQLLVDGSWKSYDEEAANNDDKSKNDGSANSPGAQSPNQDARANNGDANDNGSNNDDVDRKECAIIEESEGNTAGGGAVVDLTEEDEESPEDTMDADANDAENNIPLEPPKISPPPPLSPPQAKPNDTNDKAVEGTSNTEKPETDDGDSSAITPTTNASASTERASSTAVSSSGYMSPGIISLDSPSPPPMVALNLGDTS